MKYLLFMIIPRLPSSRKMKNENFVKKLISSKAIGVTTYVFLAAFSLLIIFIHKFVGITHNWIILYLWFINFLLTIYFGFKKLPTNWYKKFKLIFKEDKIFLGIILFLAIFTRFFILDSYPYVVIGDEIRDTGLHALQIQNGQLRDFFGFGSYQGYGNFTPLLSYFFLLLIGNSRFTFLVPSAIISILSILLTYLLTRVWTNKNTAFIASLFLIGSLIHLHYSRTELLIIIDSFLSLTMIASLYLTSYSIHLFLIFGLISGFSFHFYAATRGILVALLIYLSITSTSRIIRSILKNKINLIPKQIANAFLGTLIFFVGFFIGLGPTVNDITTKNMFSEIGVTKPIIYDSNFSKMNFIDKSILLINVYKDSLLTYATEPTFDLRFIYSSPMLNFPINIFLVLGIILILLKKKILLDTVYLQVFSSYPSLIRYLSMTHFLTTE